MLFLYRIQNDPSELGSFNACETTGDCLMDLADSLGAIFQVDFRTEFAWRIRKSDSIFGYVWRDVTSEKEFRQPLDGEFTMVRLLRLDTLRSSNERLPLRLVGQPNPVYRSDPTKVVSSSSSKKRGQEEVVPSAPPRQSERKPAVSSATDDMDFDADFTSGFVSAPPAPTVKSKPSTASIKSNTNEIEDDLDDGLTAEERARIRIEQRERAEREEVERKLQEVRAAEAAAQANANARDQAWAQQRSKLEAWSGTEKNRKPIRALLSTLHTVLWEGANWKPTNILVRPNEVRLAYRKAMLIVHPDKIPSTASPEVQVIAKYCFENLNASYEVFENTEMRTG